jgi:hypothetical protein
LAAAPILGSILAMVLFSIGFGTAGGGFGAAIIGQPLGLVAAGIVIGVAQAWVLAHVDTATGWTRHAGGRWTAATACGWIVGLAGGYAVLSLIARLVPEEWDSAPVMLAATLVALATMGALLGLAQGLVRRAHGARAGTWVAASAAGITGGDLLISSILQALTGYGIPLLGSSIGILILAAVGGALGLGLVTGLALATLLSVPALRPHLST